MPPNFDPSFRIPFDTVNKNSDSTYGLRSIVTEIFKKSHDLDEYEVTKQNNKTP